MTYQNRIAVVTGAGSGIGRALTLALTNRGAHVAAVDINQAALDQTRALCSLGRVSTYRVDVADRGAVLDQAEQVRRDLGNASLVFNNAGVDLVSSVVDMEWKDFDWLMSINVGGVINGSKAFLPQLLASGTHEQPSRLINLSSAFGLIAVPYQSAYATSKFAVRGFTEALRQEMILDRHPVTVHCVHPGVVRTNFGANMRVAENDDTSRQFAQLFDKAALTSAEKAACRILRGSERDQPRILIGPDGRALAAMARLLGAQSSALLAHGSRIAKLRGIS